MKTECNLLFTSAGRRVGVIRLFRQALQDLGMTGRIFTVDSAATAPAHQAGDAWDLLPRQTEKGYIERLWEICKRFKIGLLVPLTDAELCLLAEYRELFAKIGTTMLVSSAEVNRLSLDPRETRRFFREIGVRTLSSPEERGEERDQEAVLQEFAAGDRFSIHVLVDSAGRVRAVVPCVLMEERVGEVSQAMTVKDPRLLEAGRHVAERLPGAQGCLTLHAVRTRDGEICLTAIRPRVDDGLMLAAAAGANFPKWLLQMWRGEGVDIAPDDWQDGLMMLRYDEAFFVRKESVL